MAQNSKDVYYHLRDVLVFMSSGMERGHSFDSMIQLVALNIIGPFNKHFKKASVDLQQLVRQGKSTPEERQKVYQMLIKKINIPLFTSAMIAVDIKTEDQQRVYNVFRDVVKIIESNEEYRRNQKSRWKLVREKKKKKREELSQFIDILALTADDRKPLEETMQRVCDKLDTQISRDFQFALMEVDAGKALEDALKDLSRKTEIEEIDLLAKKLIQAKALNNSVEKTLIVEAEKIRKTNM